MSETVRPARALWETFEQSSSQLIEEFGTVTASRAISLSNPPLKLGLRHRSIASGQATDHRFNLTVKETEADEASETIASLEVATGTDLNDGTIIYTIPKPEVIRHYHRQRENDDIYLPKWSFRLDWLLEPLEADGKEFMREGTSYKSFIETGGIGTWFVPAMVEMLDKENDSISSEGIFEVKPPESEHHFLI